MYREYSQKTNQIKINGVTIINSASNQANAADAKSRAAALATLAFT